jgi:hypothetical protein
VVGGNERSARGNFRDARLKIEELWAPSARARGARARARARAKARSGAGDQSAKAMEGPSGADDMRLSHKEWRIIYLLFIPDLVQRQECPSRHRDPLLHCRTQLMFVPFSAQ